MSDGPWDPSPIYQPQRRPPSWWVRLLAALPAIVRASLAALVASAAYPRLAIATLGKPLIIPAAIALVIVTYWNVPTGVWAAWPIFALAATSPVLIVLAHLIGRSYQRPTPAVFPRSAADWLLARVKVSPQLGVTVAELERGNRRNFYHPRTRTIVLADTVRDEHTARAYAIAAHELGHALIYFSMPRLSAFAMGCRRFGGVGSRLGTIALLFIALTGSSSWLSLPLALFCAAALAHAAVALEELGASWLAMRELPQLSQLAAASPAALSTDDREWRRAARRYLVAAFTTYACPLVAALLPLFCWPQLRSFVGEGPLHPGSPLSAASSLLASGAAIALLIAISAFTSLFLFANRRTTPTRQAPMDSPPTCPPSVPPMSTPLGAWMRDKILVWIGLYLVAVPLLTVVVAGQPLDQIALWALAPAMLPTYALLSLPITFAFGRVVALLPELTLPYSPLLPRSGAGIRQLTTAALSRAPGARISCNVVFMLVLFYGLPLPLALLHLFG